MSIQVAMCNSIWLLLSIGRTPVATLSDPSIGNITSNTATHTFYKQTKIAANTENFM